MKYIKCLRKVVSAIARRATPSGALLLLPQIAATGIAIFLSVSSQVACAADNAAEDGKGPQAVDRVGDVLRAWEQRQEAVKTLRVKMDGVQRIPAGAYTEMDGPPDPAHDLQLDIKRTMYIDLQTGKIRIDTDQFVLPSNPEAQPTRRLETLTWDGTSMKAFRPSGVAGSSNDGARRVALVLYGDQPKPEVIMEIDNLPVLWSVGIFFSNQFDRDSFRRAQFDRKSFEAAPSEIPISVKEEKPHSGEFQLQQFADGRLKVWTVDPTRDAAITSFQKMSRKNGFGGSKVTIEISNQRHDLGWFPMKWVQRLYGGSSIREETSWDVVEIGFNENWSHDVFRISDEVMSPGMLVASDAKLQEVASDSHTLVPLRGQLPPVTSNESTRIIAVWVIVATNAVLLLAVVLYVRYRRMQGDKSGRQSSHIQRS